MPLLKLTARRCLLPQRLHVAFILSTAWAASALGCASTPRPKLLDQAESASQSREVTEAEPFAPQAHAHAEQLRQAAEAALDNEDPTTAGVLAEQSLAAYQRAVLLSRLARAEQRIASAQHKLGGLRTERNALSRAQLDVAAQADALELQYKVVRDAEPLEPLEKASATREAARRSLALSIVEEARLLCLAARLAAPQSDAAVRATEAQLSSLAATLQTPTSPTPVNQAVLLRSECLRHLTQLRSAERAAAPASDPADVLLTELTQALPLSAPFRDDRGVVVNLNAPFSADGKLTAESEKLLARLAEIQAAQPKFALMLVLHGKPKKTASAAAFGEPALQAWLAQRNLKPEALHFAGDRLPASVAPVRGAKPNATRVEFVFVATH